MTASFDDRVARAEELTLKYPAAANLLRFYGKLAVFQKTVFEELRAVGTTDVRALLPHFPKLIDVVSRAGPDSLAGFGTEYLTDLEIQEELLASCWEHRASDDLALDPAGRFFACVLLQPYAEYLASRADVPNRDGSASTCPFCEARPILSLLRGEGEGAKRSLVCAACSTEWPFRRVLCPHCGEENKDKLPIYTAAEFDAIRVEACDSCRTYLKSVDLTKDGHAVPVVDEIASVALDIWAEEHGYSKLEGNVLGM
jgi:FdhE protein